MTGRKISQLPQATPLVGDELVPVVQSGVTARATIRELLDLSPAPAPAFEVANRLSEIANDPVAQASVQTNLGLTPLVDKVREVGTGLTSLQSTVAAIEAMPDFTTAVEALTKLQQDVADAEIIAIALGGN